MKTDGSIIIGTKLETKQFDKQIKEVEQEIDRLEKEQASIDLKTPESAKENILEYRDLGVQIEKAKNKLASLREQQMRVNKEDISNVSKQIKEVGNQTTDVISKVGKWALAIFSVRSAYMFVRQAVETLSAENEQLGADIENIRYGLASSLLPVIQTIVGWVYKLMQYINYLTQAWFGFTLFSNKINKNLKSSNKNAKELKKTLSGFDEINVLSNENAGGDKDILPSQSFDLPSGKVPDWLEWIKNNGETVAVILGAIGGAIVGLKLANFIKNAGGATKALKSFGSALSTGLILSGLLLIAGATINLIKNWDDMDASQKRANLALIALGAGFTALGIVIRAAISTATLGLGEIIALIVALVVAIGSLTVALFTQEKAIKSTEKAQEDLKEATEALTDANDKYINSVDNAEEAQRNLEEAQRKTGLSGEYLYKQVQNGTLDYKDMTDAQREVYKAYLENTKAQDELATSTQELTEAKQKEKIASWENKLAVMAEKEQYNEYKDAVIEAFNKGELSAEEARDLIGKSMSEMSRDSQQTFMKDLPNDIRNGLDPKNYETAGQKLSKWFSNIWKGVKENAKSAWNSVKSWFGFSSGGISSGGSSKGFAVGGISTGKPIKMASGSIINQPGRGVPIMNAIGGEAGREGILPLTDAGAMAQLGYEIGRWITLNVDLVANMDKKQVARVVQKEINNNNFAFNR